MKAKRFVFLDIDGVVNHQDWYSHIHHKYSREELKSWSFAKYNMDPRTVQLLNQLTDSEVVISSSWNYDDETVGGLRDAGLKLPIIDGIVHYSLNDKSMCRGNDIARWLIEHGYEGYEDFCFEQDGWSHSDAYLSGSVLDFIAGTEKLTIGDNDYVFSYVIFDDFNDMLMQQSKHFIHVDSKCGITQQDIDRAKLMLNIS